MPSLRRFPIASLPLVVAMILACTACPSRSRPGKASEPVPARPATSVTRLRPAADMLRLVTRGGGTIDFQLPAGDSTVTLMLGATGEAAPRVRARFASAALARLALDLDRLARFEMPDTARRYMWGVQVEDAQGELALHVARVAHVTPERAHGAAPHDSFAIEARTPGAPLVLALTPDEYGEVSGLVSAYANALAMASAVRRGVAHPMYAFEVDEPVMPRLGSCFPHYPLQLRERRVTGEVIAEYVVGTNGRVEPGTFRVVYATDAAFGRAVGEATRCFRFVPARVAGAPVAQLVQQPFTFDIADEP